MGKRDRIGELEAGIRSNTLRAAMSDPDHRGDYVEEMRAMQEEYRILTGSRYSVLDNI